MSTEIIHDLQQHLDCPYYQKHDSPKFEIITQRAGYELSRKMDMATLVFVIDGAIDFTYNSETSRMARSNDLFILPADSVFSFRFLTSGSLICFYISAETDFCWRIRQKLSGYYPVQATDKDIILSATEIIQRFISNFLIITGKGVMCVKYLDCQICTLLDLICIFYPSETLLVFFDPLRSYSLGRGINFKQQVLKNKHKLFKVAEYAEALNMSRATFRRHFEQNFGMNPHDWIQREREKQIEHELKNGMLTLRQIAMKTGFTSVRNFYIFCKNYLGETAVEIRKKGRL